MPSTQLGAYSLKNESWGQKKSAYVGAEIEELAGLSDQFVFKGSACGLSSGR